MNLKSLREEAGLSQEALGQRLAEKLGTDSPARKFHQPRIAAYESGRNNISMPVAVALVKVLNSALARKKSKRRATLEDLT